jgi:DNA repair exonuclease SbcCD ATPase subunit
MAGRKKVTPEVVEGEIVSEVAVEQPGKMEFKLINPTEDGFLKEIRWNKEELDAAVRKKIADYENVVYTEDNIKQAKTDRAELNKLSNAIDERRKEVKKIINAPYAVFESEVKEILELIQKPIATIDRQVKVFEDRQKEEKKKSIRATYDEVIGDLSAVLPFEKVFDSRYLNQTYKLATAQDEIRKKIDKVRTDLDTIDGLESKFKLNAKDVYIKTFDLSKALAENKRLSDLEAKLEADKRRKAEEEAERQRREEERRKAAQEEAERKRREEECRRAAQEEAEQQKREEERRKAAQEKARVESIQPEAENKAEASKVIENKNEGNAPAANNIVSPPAGDAVVADPFSPQKEVKQYKASFTIFGTKEQIMAVKQYMIDNNIRFGKVER